MGGFFSSLFGLGSEVSSAEVELPPTKPTESTDEKKEEDVQPPRERPTGNKEDEPFAKQLLNAQNEYRMKHGAEPLTLDDSLNKEAQEWADHIAKLGNLQHAQTSDGENLAFAGPTLTAEQAANMWYNEIEDYDFSNPGFQSGTGQFTQVVWVGSKKFGAGVAKGASGMFAVGRYRPAGNMTNDGYFQANVLPAK